MNSRTSGSAALLLGLSLMLSACEQGTSTKQNEDDYAENQGGSKQSAEKSTLIQNGSGSGTLDNVNTSTTLDSKTSESIPLEADEEPISVEDEKAALIEDMGFSPQTATDLDITEESNEQRFCLGDENKAIKITAAQACDRIANRLASVTHKNCNAASLQASTCESVDGFPIFVREFSPLEDREPQGRILVIGGIHGDELTSVSIVFKWIAKLNKFHSGLFHWHVVPMMNPDGVLQRGAQRTNKNGVDLNRNLPSEDWDKNALLYWRDKQGENPRRYPGEKPASEPETQWLIDEINEFQPDAIISVHAPYGVVDFDALLLNTAPKSLGKLHLNLLGTYPGSLGNYAGINRDIPVITLELPHAWDMPSEQETTKIWEDIVSWLRENINADLANND